jgi:hypothetical protein
VAQYEFFCFAGGQQQPFTARAYTRLIISISLPAFLNCNTEWAASIKLDCLSPSKMPSQQERTFSSKSVSLNGFSGPPR